MLQDIKMVFCRKIFLILLLFSENAYSLDSRCAALTDWNDKVTSIEEDIQNINGNRNTRRSARKVPICMGTDYKSNDLDPNVQQFVPIFKDIDSKEKAKTIEIAFFDGDAATPKGFLTKISFSRVTVPEKSMTNLRQWVHISFKLKSIVGLYVQSICSPLGIPCGEFKIYPYSNCNDCPKKAWLPDTQFMAPCLYRPKASVIHPNVFLYNGASATDVHINFAWIDTICQEMLSIQFLIIAVENFATKTYEVIYSPIYANQDQDSGDGQPYFYAPHVFEEDIKCHDARQSCTDCAAATPIKLGDVKYTGKDVKLSYNYEYDDCIVDKSGKNLECPPGPFKCGINRQESSDAAEKLHIKIEKTEQSYRDALIAQGVDCSKIICESANDQREDACRIAVAKAGRRAKSQIDEPFPSVVKETFERKYSLPMYEEFIASSVLLIKAENRDHGTILIFAWFVLTLTSVFIARFYKETAGITGRGSCLGMGWWLWCHVLMSFFILGIMWMAISGILARKQNHLYTCDELMSYVYAFRPNETDKDVDHMEKLCLKEASPGHNLAHKIIGGMAISLFFLNIIAGWARPLNALTKCCITSHVSLGYFSVVLAAIALFISHECPEIKLMVFGIIAINVLVTFLFTFQIIFADRVTKERKMCPVPEVKEISGCGLLKGIAIAVQIVSTLILYILISSSYSEQRRAQDEHKDRIYFSETLFAPSPNWCPAIGIDIITGSILCKHSHYYINCS